MIGTSIRGIRHLWRLSDSSIKEVLINFKDCGQRFCHVFKTVDSTGNGGRLFILNNVLTNHDINVCTILNQKILSENDAKYVADTYHEVIVVDKARISCFDTSFIIDMTLLPDDFSLQYEKFLSDNAKMIRNLTNKYGYYSNDEISKLIYVYTDGSKNFYQWAVSLRFQCGIPLSVIRSVMLWNEGYGQMAKNLTKNTITAYTSKSDVASLTNELRVLRQSKRINDAINSFNTAQKKILREAQLTDKDRETLSKFWRLSSTKKLNFIRKVSTMDNFDDIMRLMRHITSVHFDWNKESFMDFISNVEDMKYETIFDNGNVVLIKVGDFETVKNLAKTTNWCISKNKTYWNQYVEQNYDASQYIIFDFSKKEDDLLSIVGFTTERNKGITHAHDFTNNDIMKKNDDEETALVKSFVQKFLSKNNIYSVLNSCGIDIKLIYDCNKPLFKWDRDKALDYLFSCVDKNNVDVMLDKDNKLVLSITDENIRYFLGDGYMDRIPGESWGWQHIIFMDFNINEYDPNRMNVALIKRGRDKREEEYCYTLLNANNENMVVNLFDVRISQYGLPYNIIRRKKDEFAMLNSMFMSGNMPIFKSSIKNVSKKDMKTFVYYNVGYDVFYDKISRSLTSLMTFDYIDALYDNGISMTDVMDESYVSNIIYNVLHSIVMCGRSINKLFKMPTEKEIDEFMNCELDTIGETYYVGLYLALDKIIKNEKRGNIERLYKKSLRFLLSNNVAPGEMLNHILMAIGEQIDFKKSHDLPLLLAECIKRYGGDEMSGYLADLLKKSNLLKGDNALTELNIDISEATFLDETFEEEPDEYIDEEPVEALY